MESLHCPNGEVYSAIRVILPPPPCEETGQISTAGQSIASKCCDSLVAEVLSRLL
ncbi:uncharacterized protein J3R85_015754 [Psidium guajava]|nr:uncharacterized protein J3R85_015754 [Psidium guajava]